MYRISTLSRRCRTLWLLFKYFVEEAELQHKCAMIRKLAWFHQVANLIWYRVSSCQKICAADLSCLPTLCCTMKWHDAELSARVALVWYLNGRKEGRRIQGVDTFKMWLTVWFWIPLEYFHKTIVPTLGRILKLYDFPLKCFFCLPLSSVCLRLVEREEDTSAASGDSHQSHNLHSRTRHRLAKKIAAA